MDIGYLKDGAECGVVGTTFVGIGERGFWMRDSILELWLRLLALHIEESVGPNSIASRIRNQWLFASVGNFNGCVPDGLEEAVSTEEGARLVRAAIKSLIQALRNAPNYLDKDVLNLLGMSGGIFTADFETSRLIEVGGAFLNLLDGKITANSGDATFMPGSR